METNTLARRLRREIAVVLLLKLFLLTALWWGFIRDARVTVAPEGMQTHLAGVPRAASAPSHPSPAQELQP